MPWNLKNKKDIFYIKLHFYFGQEKV
jgi:hypothetical protein